jgi:hypothetical protein
MPARTALPSAIRRGASGREQEQRQHEDGVPDRRERSGRAVAGERRRVEAEQRHEPEECAPGLRIGGQEAERNDKTDETAGIAGRPADPRQAPELPARHEVGHHGVGEDGRELGRDRADREGDEGDRDRVRRAGRREPERPRGENQHDGERKDPRLAPAGRIGDGPERRREQRDRDAGGRRCVAPERLPATGSAASRVAK